MSLSSCGISLKNVSASTTLPEDNNPYIIVVHEIEFLRGISSNSLTAVMKSLQIMEALMMEFHEIVSLEFDGIWLKRVSASGNLWL